MVSLTVTSLEDSFSTSLCDHDQLFMSYNILRNKRGIRLPGPIDVWDTTTVVATISKRLLRLRTGICTDLARRISSETVHHMKFMRNADEGGSTEERKRVLRHASSLNRADVVSKVVRSPSSTSLTGSAELSYDSDSDIDVEVLNHMDKDGLTALHHAVTKSSLDVSHSC